MLTYPMFTYYIASKLENAYEVKALAFELDKLGLQNAYDWTTHGSVQGDPEKMKEIAGLEGSAVSEADALFFILPGGRGSHVELGIALGNGRLVFLIGDVNSMLGKDRLPCAFYYHPRCFRFNTCKEAIEFIGGVKNHCKVEQHGEMRSALLDTGKCDIYEHTDVDKFWADGGDGTGENWLGKILMMERDELYNRYKT